MTPTPEQVAQWAREAQIAFCLCKYSSYELALVTRAMAEQAEADARWADLMPDCAPAAVVIRANAPKLTSFPK